MFSLLTNRKPYVISEAHFQVTWKSVISGEIPNDDPTITGRVVITDQVICEAGPDGWPNWAHTSSSRSERCWDVGVNAVMTQLGVVAVRAPCDEGCQIAA